MAAIAAAIAPSGTACPSSPLMAPRNRSSRSITPSSMPPPDALCRLSSLSVTASMGARMPEKSILVLQIASSLSRTSSIAFVMRRIGSGTSAKCPKVSIAASIAPVNPLSLNPLVIWSNTVLVISAAVWMAGSRESPTVMENVSIAPCMFSMAPPTPAFMASAAAWLAPSQFCRSFVMASMLPGALFIMASNPDSDSVPKMVANAFCLASSVIPAVAVCRSAITVPMDFILPCASKKEMPRLSMAFCACSVGFAILTNMARRVVPACSPASPASVMTPVAAASSSMLMPRDAADGAAYLNAYCKSSTPAAVLFADSASTSATWVASSAPSPNPLIALVTVSATNARSSPDASAAEITPGIEAIIWLASNPFAAISVIASAVSDADRDVFAPSSSAVSVRRCKSLSDACAIAPTFRI